MAKTIKRFERFDGVAIKVVLKGWGYSVLIKIDEGAYLWHERKNENCAIKFIVPYSKRVAQKSYKIRVNNQAYNHSKLGTPFRRNFDLPSLGTCLLYLSPSFFLTEELEEKCKSTAQSGMKLNKSQQLLFLPVSKKPKSNKRPKYYEPT